MKTLSAVFLIGVPTSVVALLGALYMRDVKMDMSHGAPTPAGAQTAKPQDVEASAAGTDVTNVERDEEKGVKSEAERSSLGKDSA